MSKLFLFVVTMGGFIFAGTFNDSGKVSDSSDVAKSKYCLVEDTSKDDFKLERRRRGGKGDGKRRRGGNGLR